MNNLFTTLVTGLALLFTLNVQANSIFPVFPINNADHKTSNNGTDFLMDDLIFTASTVSGDVGDNVCIDITVENFDNILSFQYSINFDETALAFTEVIDPENIDDLNFGTTDVANGNLSVNWFDGDVEGITVPDETLAYQICFDIISSSGAVSVSFSGSPTTIEVVDGDENPIVFQGNNGTVMTGGTIPLSVSANSATAASGDNVCLTVTANNFNNLNSFQYSMNFNPAVLMFDETINSASLTGLMFNSSGVSSGNLVVNWDSATGVTLANGTALYEVCFNLIGAGGTSSSFTFSGNPTPILITDADGENITLISNSGGVTVTGGVNNGADFIVTASTPSGNVGDVVCVDVTVENFDDILSFQYSINFDPTLLEFVEVIDPENIDDLNFGETDVSSGNLNISWFDNDINGITVPDGTLLYQVCFTVLGGNGVVPVSFSGNPTTIEVVDSNEDPVPFDSNSGGINVGGTPPLPILTVTGTNVTANNGDQVCVDISVSGFTNLTDFQYNVTFDPAVLTFAQNMDAGNLTGIMFNNGNAATGSLSVSWNSTTGVSLTNNTSIYQACFEVIGVGGTSSSYAISGGTAADIDGSINFSQANGSVTVSMPNNGTDLTFTVQTAPGNVGDQVCLNVSVENFNNVLSFQYSINFDPALLQFVEVIDPENLDDLNFGDSGATNGNLTVSWFDNDVLGIDLPDNTVLYQVCFTILSDNGGNPITVSISGNPTEIEAVDGNEDPIVFVSVPGGIGDNGITPDPIVTFSAPTVTTNNGDNICVDINTSNFTNIGSFQYTMNFDETVLTFDQNISSGNLSNLMFDNSGVGSGNLVVTWNNNGTGVTLPNNTTIYQVCFNVIGAGGTSSSLTFINSATATDGDGGNVVVNRVNGAINVMNVNNGMDFIVTGSSVSGEVGDVVCIDVTVENFNNILSFQYSMNFDPALLQFNDVIDPENLDDLNFGTSDVANGVITVNWFDGDVEGVTIPNPTLLYQVCFTIISGVSGAVTNIGFSGSPTSIEVVDGNEDPIVFASNNGSVTIGTPQDPVNFIFPDVDAMPGETICIPLTVENFNDVNSMQYTFCYDCSLLTFTEFTNLNATLDAAGSINTSNPNACELNLNWFDDDVDGETLSDNETIIEVCFQVNPSATAGQSSSLAICSSNAVPVEIADENSNLIPFIITPGSVNIIIDNPCNGPITITNSNITAAPCAGDNTGGIDITDAGGNVNGLNTYSWVNMDNPNAILATTQDLNGVGVGTYQVTITGCIAPNAQTLTQQFTITEPSPIVISVTPTPVDCNGASTGAIETTVSGGSGTGYTYTWSPVNVTGSNPTGLPAGNYAVTVADSEGCTSSFGPIVITQPNQPFTATASITNAACNGETGSIMVNASGGTTAYTYNISGGSSQSTPAFNGLAAGTYSITATDMNDCTVVLSDLEITEPAEIVITENSSSPDMGSCEGSINIDIVGGNPGGFTYNWTGPDPDAPFTSQDISGLCAGEYCVTATDNVGGCVATFCKTLIQPLTVTLISSQNACFDECNGAAIIDIIGGDGSYTVLWTDGQMTINPNDLCTGANTVTVTSDDGQMTTLEVTIQAPTSAIVINNPILTNPAAANDCTGSISISPAGGYGSPYSVTWSPPQAGTTTITELCAGTYAATVTDINGCTVTDSYTLESPELEITDMNSTPVSCNGNNDGTISFDVIGGTTPYAVVIAGPTVVTPDPNPPYLYNGLGAGVYLITVTDGAGTEEITTIEIMGGSEITTQIIKVVDATSSTLGSIQIAQPSGGTPPYSYMWSGGPNIGAMNPDNLNPGSYSLTIKDANDCFVLLEDFVTVYLIEVTDVVTVNPPCSDNPVGSITVEVPGVANNLPFMFAWQNSNGDPVGTNSPILSNAPSDTYTLTVTDSCGTSFDEIFVLVADSNLALDVEATSFFNGFNVRCNGGNSGVAEAIPDNGTLPYAYQWSNGTTNATLNNVSAGTYSVTVTDNVGCTAEGAVTLSQPTVINVDFDIDSISCNGQGDGFINANVTGGVATGGYNYFWNNGDADNSVGPVGPGNYTVEVTDGNDCEVEASIALSEPEVLDFTFITTPVTETELGSITLFPTGGTEPYFYTWPAGIVGTDMIADLNIGKYAVIVTDANGCTKMNTGIQVKLNADCFNAAPVFTPNGDGRNETFNISCADRIINLEIFNRWGQLVYEADEVDNDLEVWDGKTRRGSEVPEGTYFYVFEYVDVNTNITEQVRGYVTLLRN